MFSPEQRPVSEFVKVSNKEWDVLNSWILDHVQEEIIMHDTHKTTYDERNRSTMREVKMLYNPNITLPSGVYSTVNKIYAGLLEPVQTYFGMPLAMLPGDDEHAVVAHTHLEGDSPTEFHRDMLFTVPVLVHSNYTNSGFLHIARDPNASSIAETIANSYRVPPIARTLTLFDGINRVHGVEGVEGEPRTLLAVTYMPRRIEDLQALLSRDPSHPRARRLIDRHMK